MRFLIDTNVIIDFLTVREPFYSDADKIMEICSRDDFYGYIAAHSITDFFYILRDLPYKQRVSWILDILDFITVIGIDETKILAVLNYPDFSDLEDCLQAVCAADYGLDYIVTRNVKHFKSSAVPAIAPPEFLALINN